VNYWLNNFRSLATDARTINAYDVMCHWAAELRRPRDEDCDGLSLMRCMHQHAVPAKLPRERTVIHLVLTGAGAAEGWLNIEGSAVRVQGRPWL
jgi:hypothetical protein